MNSKQRRKAKRRYVFKALKAFSAKYPEELLIHRGDGFNYEIRWAGYWWLQPRFNIPFYLSLKGI